MAANKNMYKFEIIEAIIKAVDCSSKQQVVSLAARMKDIALTDDKLSMDIKKAFKDAYDELSAEDLTLENIKEIKMMLD